MNVVKETTAALARTSISSWIDDSDYEEMDNQFLLEALGFTVAPVLDRIVEDIEKLHGEQLKGLPNGQLSLYLDYLIAVAWGCSAALTGDTDQEVEPSDLFYKTFKNYHRPTEDEEFDDLDFGSRDREPAWCYPHAPFDSRENYYAYRVSRFARVSDPVRLVSLALTRFGNIGLSFYEDAFFKLSLKKVKNRLVSMHGAQPRNFYLPSEATRKQYASDNLTSEELKRVAPYREAIRLTPNDPDAWLRLGEVYGKLGKHDEAESAFGQVVKLKPDDSYAWYLLGVSYGQQRKFDDAVAAYREAIKLKPDYPEAWCNLGLACGDHGKRDDAVAAYCQAIKLRPDYPEAWSNLGWTYEIQGKSDEAVAAYRQVTKLKPGDRDAWHDLGIACEDYGKYDEAETVYREIIKLAPDTQYAWFYLGLCCGHQDKYDDAIAAYREAINLKPDSPETWYNLGEVYEKQGKRIEALDALDHLRKLDSALADKLANVLAAE